MNKQYSDFVFYSQVTIEESMGLVKHQASIIEVFGDDIPTININSRSLQTGAKRSKTFQRRRTVPSRGRSVKSLRTVSRSK